MKRIKKLRVIFGLVDWAVLAINILILYYVFHLNWWQAIIATVMFSVVYGLGGFNRILKHWESEVND